MRASVGCLAALCLVGVASCLLPPPGERELRIFSQAGERPRSTLVLFTIDSVRAEHVGAYGYTRATTPVFDALSQQGRRFARAYAQAPHTSFSITSLLTGRYFGPLSRMRPGLHVPTLAHMLRQAGYATLAIYPPAVSVTDPTILRPYRQEHFGFQHVRCDYISADQSVAEAMRFLADQRPQRAFIWIHVFEPHEPYQAGGAPAFGDTAIDRYDQELVVVDAALGRLVRFLRAERPEAVLAVTADHGEAFNDHGESLHGTNLYEEQIRVPLLLAGPGISPGVHAEPVQLIDIAPTLLQLAGATDLPPLDGKDLLRRQREKERVAPAISGLASQYALVAWPWKLTRDLQSGQTALYDLVHDPRELTDRSRTQVQVREQLHRDLDAWLAARLRDGQQLAQGPALPRAILRGRLGDAAAVPGLLDVLAEATDPSLRQQAAALLVRLPVGRRDLARLRPLLNQTATAQRGSLQHAELAASVAVLALRAGLRSQATPVHAIAQGSTYDLDLRLRAAAALAEARDGRAGPVLLTLLDRFAEQGEYRACREVIAALATLRDRRAVPALLGRIKNVMVQLEVIAALDAIAAPEAVPPLIDLLAHSDRVPTRIAAATTLGRIGRSAAQATLLAVAKHDGEPAVRRAAEEALTARRRFRSGAWPPTR